MKLFVLAGTHDKFTEEEFKFLKVNEFHSHEDIFLSIPMFPLHFYQEFIDNGGALMILLGEGGETEFNTNLNFLLEEYGMNINSGLYTILQLPEPPRFFF